MGVIKLGIISVIFFAIFLTILSFFFPSRVRISKAIEIKTEIDSLNEYLVGPVNWSKWMPGADSAIVIPNGIRTANGNELVITSVSDSSVTTTTFNKGSVVSRSGWYVMLGTRPGSFTIQWYMDFHLGWYPWDKFSSLLLEKRYGPAMEKGLEKLKALLEK